jgi:hypothetical protein
MLGWGTDIEEGGLMLLLLRLYGGGHIDIEE